MDSLHEKVRMECDRLESVGLCCFKTLHNARLKRVRTRVIGLSRTFTPSCELSLCFSFLYVPEKIIAFLDADSSPRSRHFVCRCRVTRRIRPEPVGRYRLPFRSGTNDQLRYNTDKAFVEVRLLQRDVRVHSQTRMLTYDARRPFILDASRPSRRLGLGP